MKPRLYKPIHDELARYIDTMEGPYTAIDRQMIKIISKLSRKYDCSDLVDAYARKRKIYILDGPGNID